MSRTKICSKCKKHKPATSKYFYQHKRYKNGLNSRCIKCAIEYGQQWRQSPHGNAMLKKSQERWRLSVRGKIKSEEYKHSFNRHLHASFVGLRSHCTNPNDVAYKNYGGRGIQLRFKNYTEYRKHIVGDLGYTHAKLREGLRMGRININGHYEKGNLQIGTRSQLHQGSRKIATINGIATSSEFKGVHWRERIKRWYASITIAGKRYHLGSFTDEVDAALAYDEASEILHGNHGCTNADLGLL